MGCCSNFLTRPRLPLALSAHQSPRGVVCTPPTSDKLCGRCTPSVGHRFNDRRGPGPFGVIGVGSIIAFMIGAIMMFPPGAPGFELSPVVIAGVVVVTASFFMLVLSMLFRSRKRLALTGREALLGAEGDAVAWQGADGRVLIRGEIWRARAARPLQPGTRGKVIDRNGLVLVQSAGRP